MPGIQQGVEDSFDSRPLGMPCLSVLKTECQKLGLTPADAEDQYDYWLMTGFKMKNGRKISNWQAAVRNRFRRGYFPSQQKQLQDRPEDYKEQIRAKIRRMQNGS